jgi:hypothetical protein
MSIMIKGIIGSSEGGPGGGVTEGQGDARWIQLSKIQGGGEVAVKVSGQEVIVSASQADLTNLSALSQFNNDVGFITDVSADTRYLRLNSGSSAQTVSASQVVFDSDLLVKVDNSLVAYSGTGSGSDVQLRLQDSSKTVALQGQQILLGAFDNYTGSIIGIGDSNGGGAETIYIGNNSFSEVFINDERWPTTFGSNGQVLTVSSFGQLSWSTPTTGLTEASADGRYVQLGDLSALSQFNNDVGFITEASADAAYLSANTPIPDLADLSALSQFNNDVGFITEASADAAYVPLESNNTITIEVSSLNLLNNPFTGSLLAQNNETEIRTNKFTVTNNDGTFGPNIFLGVEGNQPAASVEIGVSAATQVKIAGNIHPTDKGSNGQVLTTNGAGTLSWQTPSGGPTSSVLTVSAQGTVSVSAGLANTTIFMGTSAVATIIDDGWTPADRVEFIAEGSAVQILGGTGITINNVTNSAAFTLDADNLDGALIVFKTSAVARLVGGIQ